MKLFFLALIAVVVSLPARADAVRFTVKFPEALREAVHSGSDPHEIYIWLSGKNPPKKFSATGIEFLQNSALVKADLGKELPNFDHVRIVWTVPKEKLVLTTQVTPIAEAVKPDSPKALLLFVERKVGKVFSDCGSDWSANVHLRLSSAAKSHLKGTDRFSLVVIYYEETFPAGLNASHGLVDRIGRVQFTGAELLHGKQRFNVKVEGNRRNLGKRDAFFAFRLAHCNGSCADAERDYAQTRELTLVPRGYIARSFCDKRAHEFLVVPEAVDFSRVTLEEMQHWN